MSVFKRPGAETFSYDFWVGGHRFSGPTGATTRREAERVQARRRREELTPTRVWLFLAFAVVVPTTASAGAIGSLLGGNPPPRSQSIDALRTTPRLDPNIPDAQAASRPTPSVTSPTLAIPGAKGKAALGVEPPAATNPGNRIILAPSMITTPPRDTRGQSGNVPAFSITIPSN